MSLYTRLLSEGVIVSNHESDLYFPVNETTKRILGEAIAAGEIRARPSIFKSNVDGKMWYDAFAMYDPFWQNRGM